MYIDNLEIQNFRCFQQAEVSFLHPGPQNVAEGYLENINLILGDNGSGKSSVLKAVALSVLGSVLPDSGYRPYFLVRATSKAGKASARLSARALLEPSELSTPTCQFQTVVERFGVENSFSHQKTGVLNAKGNPVTPDRLRVGENPSFFLCGYGAGRTAEVSTNYDRTSRIRGRSQRYQRVAGLFEEHYTLTPFSPWMTQLSGGSSGKVHHHYEAIVPMLERLLEDTGITWTRGIYNGEAEFKLSDDPKVQVPTDALSDGFRAYLSWLVDLISQLAEACPREHSLERLSGVVLVDEIDLHLHPSWQRRLLPNLSKAFPKLQFIVTSHSPILAGSIPPENIHVVERTPEGPSTITRADKSYYGRAIDEILTGDYFELESVLPPVLEQKRKVQEQERTELARKVLTSQSPEDARAYLKSLEMS